MKATLHKRGPNTTDDAVEQTLLFGNAIMASVEATCKEQQQAGKTIEMRALLGALTSVTAHFVAGIDNEEHRIHTYGKIGQELYEMIDENVSLGTGAQTYSDGDFKQ